MSSCTAKPLAVLGEVLGATVVKSAATWFGLLVSAALSLVESSASEPSDWNETPTCDRYCRLPAFVLVDAPPTSERTCCCR